MDAWCGVERLYGMDDFVGSTGPWLREDPLRQPVSARVMWRTLSASAASA